MEVTFYEDPACSWCWAFQPVSTTFLFEFGLVTRSRYVMGGLRDRPPVDVGFMAQQWKKAAEVSGMPFDEGIWRERGLRTTFVACRAVKAASIISEVAAFRLLRRMREALFLERTGIDDCETVLELARDVGISVEQLRDHLESGRAEALFALDRAEASRYGFGFPTIIVRDGHQDPPVMLQGAIPYADLVQAVTTLGVDPAARRRFRSSPEHWEALFAIHPRMTFAELRTVTHLDKGKLKSRLQEAGARQHGPFYTLPVEGVERSPEETPEAPRREAVVSRSAGTDGGS